MGLSHVVACVSASPTLLILSVSAAIFLAYTLAHYFVIRRHPANIPHLVRDNFPITGPVGFWTERWSWYKRQRDAAPNGNFSFNVGSHTMIALTGEEGRKLFYDSRHLGLREGYSVMFGNTPKITGHDDGEGKENEPSNPANHFDRHLAHLLKTDVLSRKLPTLISDIHEALEAIKSDPTGTTNPFDTVYRVVFRLTMRMVGAEEMANNPELLEETLRIYQMVETSTTATATMFPKFPSPAVLKRTYGGGRLYMILEKIVKQRATSGEKQDDALQHMLDQGERTFKIVEYILGALTAGIVNSGVNAAWVLCYLATSPEWRTKTYDEVRSLAAKYAGDTSAPLLSQLSHVPLEAWENELPLIDLCLRDSIRLNLVGTQFRRNLSNRAIPTGKGNEVIPPGAFVTYAVADVHQDPAVYPNPEVWDPARYFPDRAEDKKGKYTWVGWGVSRHPCRK
jgi:cytochrome P450